MSATDLRQIIDIHGGHFIGVECQNGIDIEIGIDGELPIKATTDVIMSKIVPRLRERMAALERDGFKSFEFGVGGNTVQLNYYDAGFLLDTLIAMVRRIE